MLCPKCQKNVSSYDIACPHCGAQLSDHPAKKYIRDVEKIVEGRPRKPPMTDNNQRMMVGNQATHEQAQSGMRHSEEDTEAEDIKKAIKKAILMILHEQENKIHEVQYMIFGNSHILTNDEWSTKAKLTYLSFDWDNKRVNANAGALTPKEIDQTDGKFRYLIRIFGGYVNLAYAVASTYRYDRATGDFYDFEKLDRVITMLKKCDGEFGIEQVLMLMPDKRYLSRYGADAFKIIYECIAHELGHICYGHVHSPGYDDCEPEVNISTEFDADSFAYAVIASSSFKEELWWGLIQFTIVEAAIEILKDKRTSTTHPLTIDRLKTAISRFPELAAARNINEQWAEKVAARLSNWLS